MMGNASKRPKDWAISKSQARETERHTIARPAKELVSAHEELSAARGAGGMMGRVTTTPVTNFRIPPDIKAAAIEKAKSEGKTLSRVVIDLLREYARNQ